MLLRFIIWRQFRVRKISLPFAKLRQYLSDSFFFFFFFFFLQNPYCSRGVCTWFMLFTTYQAVYTLLYYKWADPDHSAHAQSTIRAFILHLYIL